MELLAPDVHRIAPEGNEPAKDRAPDELASGTPEPLRGDLIRLLGQDRVRIALAAGAAASVAGVVLTGGEPLLQVDAALIAALHARARLVIMPSFDLGEFLGNIANHKCTIAFIAPPVLPR